MKIHTKLEVMLSIVSLGILSLGIVIGCESKFSESSPASVSINGLTLEERLTEKEKIDSRIDEIQQGANKAKKIIEMFKKIQDPSSKEDVYTPLDFLLELNEKLKDKIPEIREGKLLRFSQLYLPIESLSEECKTVETMLSSESVYDESFGDEKKIIGDRLSYSLKSCGSNGYKKAVDVDWIGQNLEVKFANENLKDILTNIIIADNQKNSSCKIKQGEKGIIDSIECYNLNLQLSTSEVANIKRMVFNNVNGDRLSAEADIYENNKIKAVSEIQVTESGEVKFHIKNIKNEDASEFTSKLDKNKL